MATILIVLTHITVSTEDDYIQLFEMLRMLGIGLKVLFAIHALYIYFEENLPIFLCVFGACGYTPVFYLCCKAFFSFCSSSNVCVSACTPVFYSCYVHLFCRSEQSVSSLNICTADSPPHTGLDNTYQLLYFICILFSFYLYFIVLHFV